MRMPRSRAIFRYCVHDWPGETSLLDRGKLSSCQTLIDYIVFGRPLKFGYTSTHYTPEIGPLGFH